MPWIISNGKSYVEITPQNQMITTSYIDQAHTFTNKKTAEMIPLKKQSKKAQKEQHAKQRGSWYGISPVTRTVPNGKAYDRNRVKRKDREFAD